EALVKAGIDDIMIVTGGRKSGDFLSLLGNGKDFGLKHLNYTYQEGEGGIAEALGLAEHWAKGDSVCVILGDNILERTIKKAAGCVWDMMMQPKRSERGELEIIDFNNCYLQDGSMTYEILDGWWTDA